MPSAVWYVLYMLFRKAGDAGIGPNFQEHGGPDTAILNSVANALGNIPVSSLLCSSDRILN